MCCDLRFSSWQIRLSVGILEWRNDPDPLIGQSCSNRCFHCVSAISDRPCFGVFWIASSLTRLLSRESHGEVLLFASHVRSMFHKVRYSTRLLALCWFSIPCTNHSFKDPARSAKTQQESNSLSHTFRSRRHLEARL